MSDVAPAQGESTPGSPMGPERARPGYLTPRRIFSGIAVALTVILVILVIWLIYLLLRPGGLVARGGADVAGLTPLLTITGPGKGANPDFKKPMGAAFGIDGRIYVSDTGNNRVCVFDRDGGFLFEFGGFGVRKALPGGTFSWSPGRMDYPIGISVDPTDGSVYVADFRNDQIQRFSADGSFTAAFPDPTKPVGRGSSGQEGTGIAVTDVAARGGKVYATDAYQVFVFGSDGRLIRQFGKPGVGPTDLDHPNGIAAGPDGRVYVSDSNHARVIAFDARGARLWAYGELPLDGAASETSGALGMPRGLAVDGAGTVYVADSFLFGLVALSPDGGLIGRFGQRGDVPAEFNFPNDVDERDGLLLVADKENNRVQVLTLARR
ncbi:MAG: hypothetical protein Q7W30_00740 [Coriobacteriia bacterium]|nr:hypothetical protein [Coriobacteriia bacterium]